MVAALASTAAPDSEATEAIEYLLEDHGVGPGFVCCLVHHDETSLYQITDEDPGNTERDTDKRCNFRHRPRAAT